MAFKKPVMVKQKKESPKCSDCKRLVTHTVNSAYPKLPPDIESNTGLAYELSYCARYPVRTLIASPPDWFCGEHSK